MKKIVFLAICMFFIGCDSGDGTSESTDSETNSESLQMNDSETGSETTQMNDSGTSEEESIDTSSNLDSEEDIDSDDQADTELERCMTFDDGDCGDSTECAWCEYSEMCLSIDTPCINCAAFDNSIDCNDNGSIQCQWCTTVGKCTPKNEQCRCFISLTDEEYTLDQAEENSFSGRAEVDLICQKEASDAGRPGLWKAILSTSASDAKDRFSVEEVGLVQNVHGDVLASDYLDLWDGSINYPVQYTFTGQAQDSGIIWTGSNSLGEKRDGEMCSDWISQTGTAALGHVLGGTEMGWWLHYAAGSTYQCGGARFFYCMSCN